MGMLSVSIKIICFVASFEFISQTRFPFVPFLVMAHKFHTFRHGDLFRTTRPNPNPNPDPKQLRYLHKYLHDDQHQGPRQSQLVAQLVGLIAAANREVAIVVAVANREAALVVAVANQEAAIVVAVAVVAREAAPVVRYQ